MSETRFRYLCVCGKHTTCDHPSKWTEITFMCANCKRFISVDHNPNRRPPHMVRMVVKPRDLKVGKA